MGDYKASNWYLEGHRFDSRWGSENSFSEYFDLRTLLHYLHFIQVSNPFIIYSHVSFRYVEPCSMAGHMSHI